MFFYIKKVIVYTSCCLDHCLRRNNVRGHRDNKICRKGISEVCSMRRPYVD